MMKTTLISAKELCDLRDDKNLILVDASGGSSAWNNYENQHLKNAVFVDLETDLAHIKQDVKEGGRHPLPEISRFCELVSDLGIHQESKVVVYDDKMGANAAARFWWMLKSIGHELVWVLNGGIQQAIKNGFPVSTEIIKPTKTEPYQTKTWQLKTVSLFEVEHLLSEKKATVIDVRDAARFRGEVEPIDLIAGHIPGAINIPFSENMNVDGLFLSADVLKAKYENKFKSKEVIVHCGSGVTACHTILACAYAGLDIPVLYVGSWSEWSRNDKPIGKGD